MRLCHQHANVAMKLTLQHGVERAWKVIGRQSRFNFTDVIQSQALTVTLRKKDCVKVILKITSMNKRVLTIIKNHLKTGKTAQVILFCDDLSLAADTLIDYYSLRFQIEFNFRDAKQYWGLEDFMNIKKTQVNNMTTIPCLW